MPTHIAVPLGAVAAVGVLVLLHVKQPTRKFDGNLLSRIMCFDPIGNVCFIISIACLLLALQLGPTSSYSNGGIIACFVIFGTLLIAWVAIQILLGEEATCKFV